ncbi:MerR family transcriptional regulator [Virgibacillus xinjiangensis]|uniref:MerR family transcriptional regulator n=1 Tax=Virgibacillus xinjiangensis TaxID=393090 RepID=A0ABV7CXA9_9BACI
MEYTVQGLANMAGVSRRTLRYYDEIDLLKPARISTSGYRIYGEKEVDQLQQILFYREMDVPLDEIRQILMDPKFDEGEALSRHYRKLKSERNRLNKMLEVLEETIASKQGGKTMRAQRKFEAFKKEMVDENERTYGDEIRQKYGDETIDKSNAQLMGLSEQDYREMEQLSQEILTLLPKAKAAGDPNSKKAQQLAAKHKQWLMFFWESYSKEAHASLAKMYVADERFSAYYDRAAIDGAKFLRDAILHYTS